MSLQPNKCMYLDRGAFTISIDFELIWGTLDLFGPSRYRKACEIERLLIDRLLDLFVAHELPATWCILGHLFLRACLCNNGQKHPEIVRPTHAWCQNDWFEHDPCSNEADAPLFYASSLIDKIRACPVQQDIGCHTFSHVIFGDNGCSRATAASELKACMELASDMGIEMRSFAFPRNEVGHLDVLHEFGFRCYRGPEPVWHERSWMPNIIKRCGRLLEILTITRPPTVLPQLTSSGLWNVPGSMIYFPMNGFRKFIPMNWRIQRAVKGLHDAVKNKRIFHLWFHPTNLADHPEEMFSGLARILEHATLMHRRGDLDICSMTALASASEHEYRRSAPNSNGLKVNPEDLSTRAPFER